MKLTCCCLTCFIGDPEAHREEEARLIAEEKKPQKDERRFSAKSSPSLKRKSNLARKRRTSGLDVNVFEESTEKSSDEERLNRKAHILKKYNVDPANINEQERIYNKQISETGSIDLKLGIKTMLHSKVVKIFALQATNLMFMLRSKSPPETLSDEKIIVQLRTKVIPIEARGHSKKYEIRESLTGTMKFMNECVHEIQLVEIKHLKIRFRIYHVLKKHRDILLCEYVLNLGSNLGYDSSGTVNVILPMHEPDATVIRQPIISETRRSLSSLSSAQSGNSSFHLEVTGVDVDESVKEEEKEEDEHQVRKKKLSVLKQLRELRKSIDIGSAEKHPKASLERLKSHPAETTANFDHLKHGLLERHAKVGVLENKTEEMQSEAKNFNAMAHLLQEKYHRKSMK